MGMNCINCHSATGDAEGCFSIGGTAYREDLSTVYPGCTIEFYTEPEAKGEFITSLISDSKGNLYTGREIKWGKGLYPTIISPEGKSKHMLKPINQGACNNCHGQTTSRIFIN